MILHKEKWFAGIYRFLQYMICMYRAADRIIRIESPFVEIHDIFKTQKKGL